jgi:hypothetical protein
MDRLSPASYQKRLARWRQRYYQRQQHHIDRAYTWNVKNKDRVYLNSVKHKYGLKAKEHAELFEAQGGRCAICFVHQDQLPTRLHTDHCHETGTVRGLLCKFCNLALGGHQKAGTGVYGWYLQWTPMMRLQKMKTLTDEERHLWNW